MGGVPIVVRWAPTGVGGVPIIAQAAWPSASAAGERPRAQVPHELRAMVARRRAGTRVPVDVHVVVPRLRVRLWVEGDVDGRRARDRVRLAEIGALLVGQGTARLR